MNLFEALEALNKIYLDESAKTDFINKFGQDTFNNFEKARQRLVNKGLSVDYSQYLKKDKKEVDDLILSLYDDKKDAQKKRILQGTDKEIRGEYRDLGIRSGYHVFEPLDVQSSIDLGVNTGWCTTGRYGHYGHPEFNPSYEDAKRHWESYTSKGIRFFYLLDPDIMYGKYAIALYPKVLVAKDGFGTDKHYTTNIEVYNDKDELDFTIADQIDLSKLIGEEIVFKEADEIEIDNGVLVKYRGSDEQVNIPDNVMRIGNYAFSYCFSLKSINIPDNVTSIGDSAFERCSRLKSINIPDSVTHIGKSAFNGCSRLTSITIPNSITSIGACAFWNCKGLRSINIPDTVTRIGNRAFYGCRSLTSVTIPDSVTSIGAGAFYGCPSDLTIKTNNEYVKHELRDTRYNIVSY